MSTFSRRKLLLPTAQNAYSSACLHVGPRTTHQPRPTGASAPVFALTRRQTLVLARGNHAAGRCIKPIHFGGVTERTPFKIHESTLHPWFAIDSPDDGSPDRARWPVLGFEPIVGKRCLGIDTLPR